MNKVNIYHWSIPIWLMILFSALLESIIFILPNYFDSVSIFGLSIKLDFLTKLPVWAIIIINGVAIGLYLLSLKSRVDKRINEEQWK